MQDLGLWIWHCAMPSTLLQLPRKTVTAPDPGESLCRRLRVGSLAGPQRMLQAWVFGLETVWSGVGKASATLVVHGHLQQGNLCLSLSLVSPSPPPPSHSPSLSLYLSLSLVLSFSLSLSLSHSLSLSLTLSHSLSLSLTLSLSLSLS